MLVHELYQITKGVQSTLSPQTAFNIIRINILSLSLSLLENIVH